MVKISTQVIWQLRIKTGFGLMACKKALQESGGDIAKARELLQKWDWAAPVCVMRDRSLEVEGLVGSYIHTGSRLGVLVEVHCETDFAARSEVFQTLVHNIAMQVAACPNVEYVQVNDIPAVVSAKEKEIEMGRHDLADKPDDVKETIVRGRLEKRLKELCLIEQPYIRNQSISVEELIEQARLELGENIRVRRFTRYVLGEGY